jgi:hypothetical protein
VWDFDAVSDTLFEDKLKENSTLRRDRDENTSSESSLTYEQIILLKILLVIFEDSEFTEELNRINHSDSKNHSHNVHNYDDNFNISVTWSILHVIAELISTLCNDHYKHNNIDVNSNNIDNNNSTMKSTGMSFEKDTEVLLLCLNTFGAGVSYPPRDLGSPLRWFCIKEYVFISCIYLYVHIFVYIYI